MEEVGTLILFLRGDGEVIARGAYVLLEGLRWGRGGFYFLKISVTKGYWSKKVR